MDTRRRSPDLLFVLWIIVGAGLCLGVVSILSIGVFVLPVALVLAGLLLRWGGPGRALAGALSGAGAPLLYMAWLNRGGPGEVCHAITGGLECTDETSPWPRLLIGLALAAAGLVLFALTRPKVRADPPESFGQVSDDRDVLRVIQLDATPDTPADRARALSATGVAGLFTFEGPHARRADRRRRRRPDAARVLGSTPAYRPVLEVEGWAAKQPGLKVLSKTGDLAAMADLVDDTMLATLAVRGTPEECAAEIRRRFGDVAERVCAHFPGYDAPLDQARDLTVARR